MESIFLAVLAVSGLVNIWSIWELSRDDKGRNIWFTMIFGKIVCMIFYTNILEALILSWNSDQVELTPQQQYGARTFKFVLVLIAFILSASARIYREETTKFFTRTKQ